jgi:hypothetical protein
MSVEDPTVVLVIASAREQQFGLWVDAWWDEERRRFPWDKTILVQDGDGPARFRPDDTDGDDVYERWDGIIHYTWGDIGKGYPGPTRGCRTTRWAACRSRSTWGCGPRSRTATRCTS